MFKCQSLKELHFRSWALCSWPANPLGPEVIHGVSHEVHCILVFFQGRVGLDDPTAAADAMALVELCRAGPAILVAIGPRG